MAELLELAERLLPNPLEGNPPPFEKNGAPITAVPDPAAHVIADVFKIVNDPFVGKGSHLPDVAILAPVFRDGKVVLFVSNIAHHSDVGGMAPGSMAGGMTEIYQEGLRIPPVRLYRAGKLQQDVMDLILLNMQVPRERLNDFRAQMAAMQMPTPEDVALFRVVPEVISVLDYTKGFAHTDLVTC